MARLTCILFLTQYSNRIFGFYTSPTGKDFSGHTLSCTQSTISKFFKRVEHYHSQKCQLHMQSINSLI